MKKFACLTFGLCIGALGFLKSVNLPIEIVNNSNTPNANIYWAILGFGGETPYKDMMCYVTPAGALLPVKEADNGAVTKGGTGYSNYFYRLSENPLTSLPAMYGARLFITIDEIMYFKIIGNGYAGADLSNPGDPNANVKFEIIEFTYDNLGYHGNTTRVDHFSYPISMRLTGAGTYDRIVGEYANHATILSRFKTLAPAAFQACVKGEIIFAPGKVSGFLSNYFAAYMDQIWEKYAAQDLKFSCDAGTFVGRVQTDGRLVFRRNSDNAPAVISRKPTTIEILEGSGVLAEGGDLDKVVQAQFCAAANRHVIEENSWAKSNLFYQTEPYNFYASFWHLDDISYGKRAYGFCYDDVFDQSTLLEHQNPTKLYVYIGGGGSDDPTGGNPIMGDGAPNVGGPLPCSGEETTTNGLIDYSYEFVPSGNSVTVTMTALTPKTGYVCLFQDKTSGVLIESDPIQNKTVSKVFSADAGETVTVAVKWMFVGGDAFSRDFVYKIGSGCDVATVQNLTKQIPATIYPDPGRNTLTISLASPADALQVYAIDGRLMYIDTVPFQSKILSCSNWNSGVYIVKIRQNNQWIVQKIVL